MSARSLAWAAALALLAGTARPCNAQSGSSPQNTLGRALGAMGAMASAMTSEPNALTASYSGAISFSGPGKHIAARVTRGRVQCTGSASTGEGSITYGGVGKIDLELGLSTTDARGRRLTDQYRITLHCPVNLPEHEDRSLADIANTAYQPGGGVSRSSGGLVGPERLKGEWHANGEVFSWDLCRGNCRQPPP